MSCRKRHQLRRGRRPRQQRKLHLRMRRQQQKRRQLRLLQLQSMKTTEVRQLYECVNIWCMWCVNLSLEPFAKGSDRHVVIAWTVTCSQNESPAADPSAAEAAAAAP
jgi:hypothetical protein